MSFQFMNNFRGIAILMVILAHSMSVFPTIDTFGLGLLNSHMDNCTILFIAIAGYLFSVLSNNYSYLPFLKGKFKSVIVPYIFISIPAILLYILKLKNNHAWIDLEWFHSSLSPVGQYMYLMVTGAHLGPLWFVPMIVIFYVLSPLLILIQRKGALFIAFFVSLLLAMYFGRPLFNDNALGSFVFFLPSYFFGMLLAEKKWLYEAAVKNNELLLLLYVVLVSAVYMMIEINSSIDLCIKLLLTILLLAFCKKRVNHKVIWLDLFARLSFYLFFIHGYFTGILRITFRQTGIQPDEYVALVCIFVFIVFMSLSVYGVCKLVLKDRTKFVLGA